jgi:hypothetical protein
MDALKATAAKKAQGPRPFAEHASKDGAFGTHCGLGDPGFKSWTCPSGLRCVDVHGDVVGMCSEGGTIGDICVASKITLDEDSHKDKRTKPKLLDCKGGANAGCQDGGGFPDGLCADDCKQVGKVTGDKFCASVPDKDKNTKCLIEERRPFPECLKEAGGPLLVRSCDAKTPCRDDWACMRVDGGPLETGACMPPYFAFQVRVVGHMFDDE